jgi:glyoxylase-like metal-dependent hydrolase (beta-lactamase superfamily II)
MNIVVWCTSPSGDSLLTKIDERTYIIDTMSVGRPGVVAAYLIHGKENALIDMGYASSSPTVLKDVEASEASAEGVHYLLPTHVHLDHSGACAAIAHHFANAAIRVHPKGERHLVDPTMLWEGATKLFGAELMQLYGKPQALNGNRVKAIYDNEKIMLGNGLVLRCIWTPGHASHHLSYELEGTGSIFTGDAVGIKYPAFPVLIPTTPPTSFNLEAAITSLQRLKQLRPKRLLTPHFGVIPDAVSSIDANIQSLHDWIARIREMVRSGSSSELIVSNLTEETRHEIAGFNGDVPDYVRLSIKVSVLGAIGYMEHAERHLGT